MNIYVAAPWPRRAEAALVAKMLTDDGHRITHRWWEVEPGDTGDNLDNEGYVEFAANDQLGVKNADALLLLVPKQGGCGMFVELGLALAYGKAVIEVNLDETGKPPVVRSIFDHLTVRMSSLTAALEFLHGN